MGGRAMESNVRLQRFFEAESRLEKWLSLGCFHMFMIRYNYVCNASTHAQYYHSYVNGIIYRSYVILAFYLSFNSDTWTRFGDAMR